MARCGWVVMVLGVVAVSLYPLPPGTEIPGGDKTAHFLAYMVLALGCPWRLDTKRALALFGGLACLGLMLEAAQHVMDIGRCAEAADAVANALGALAGCVIRRAHHAYTTGGNLI
ncbi:MAG: hypothetical protein CSA21_05910 [Deltaproteobacteria bacterium]|nr:MAG: hypothetical protein CSA21_05910 [Deltaproteobacteria bacterium]